MPSIADLPFVERPIIELLALEQHHTIEEARQYAGFGWARASEIELEGVRGSELLTNALVIAVHADDFAEDVPGDIELAFELPDTNAKVLLSKFLAVWLPKLPPADTIVLAVCNPFNATLTMPGPPLRYPLGEAVAWIDKDRVPPIRLEAETWCTLGT